MARPDRQHTTRVIEVYERFLTGSAAGSASDFEALCAEHPDLADDLRAMRLGSASLDHLLPGPLEVVVPVPPDAPQSGLLSRLRALGRARFDRYRILEEIGRGGMGIVYRAQDLELDRELAMKVLRPKRGCWDEATRARMHERFVQEARVTGQLEHPGIVSINELGITPTGDPFFVMRLVKGESLRSVFRHVEAARDGWTRDRALEVLVAVCDTMGHAHARGVVHRDLKPGNVMVGDSGEVCVVDWGLARGLAHVEGDAPVAPSVASDRSGEAEGIVASRVDLALLTADGECVGTPAFMAPEQARGDHHSIGVATDVYAVGAILYQLLCGSVPYAELAEGMPARAVLARVAEGRPKPLRDHGRAVPPELAAICERAMAPAQHRRYADMEALANDLRAYLTGRVVLAYRTGWWNRTRKWLKRNRLLAGLSTGALGLVATSAFLVWSRMRTSDDDRMREVLTEVAAFQVWASDGSATGQGGRSVLEEWLHRSADLIERLAPFERHARPATPEQRAAAEAAFPGTKELSRLEADLAWRDRVLGIEAWTEAGDVEAEYARATTGLQLPAQVREFNERVFRRIRPDEPRRHGQERVALLLAERLVVLAAEEPSTPIALRGHVHPRYRDTLATAQWRCGLFDLAVNTQRQAANGPFWDHGGYDAEHWRRDVLSTLRFFERQARMAKSDLLRRSRDRLAFAVDLLRLEQDAHAFSVAGDAIAEEHARAVATLRQLRHRRRMAEDAAPEGRFGTGWNRAIAFARSSPIYQGLQLVPQVGLVPLGDDPATGLLEFADLFSGEPPDRIERKLDMDAGSATVFVLLPPGKLVPENQVGTRARPIVELSAYFLSKFEFTDHQLEGLGAPSRGLPQFAAEIRATPAYGLSWAYCTKVLAGAWSWQHLPSGDEWEYGARGGTTTRWWTGDDVRELLRTARIGLPIDAQLVAPLEDREPNPFGLVDVHGNVVEWCVDARPGQDPVSQQLDEHMVRGGCSTDDPEVGASGSITYRSSNAPLVAIGLRPARWLTR